MTLSKYHKRRSDKYKRLCDRLATMRAAKERKRLERAEDREERLVRFYPLEFCFRNKLTGETSEWHDVKSARAMERTTNVLLKYYVH